MDVTSFIWEFYYFKVKFIFPMPFLHYRVRIKVVLLRQRDSKIRRGVVSKVFCGGGVQSLIVSIIAIFISPLSTVNDVKFVKFPKCNDNASKLYVKCLKG